jgi:nickel-type superoxide dismutase maturation protease
MVPTLQPGDCLVVVRWPWLRVGHLVAVADPRRPDHMMVKRVAAIDPVAHTVTVLGDNVAGSTDSRHFGPVPRATVAGRALYRYAPTSRAGRLK